MRFLFLAPRLHNNYYEVMKALIEHGHTVQAGVLYTLPTERYAIVQPHILGYAQSFRWLKWLFQKKTTSVLKDRFELRYGFPPLRATWRLLRESKAEVLVVKNIDSVFSLIVLCIGRLMRKRLLISLQIDKYRPQPKSGSVAWVGCVFGARVITPLLGDQVYPNENTNLFYIPFTHAIDDRPVQRTGRTGPFRILCVAKFQKRKNQLLLLQALSKLPEARSYELHLVGQQGEPEYLAILHRYLEAQDLTDRVTIRCDLPWEEMQSEYRWADLYVLPSAREPASVSVLEAMSFGLPVICSDQNGTKCYVLQGENGAIFQSGDEQGLMQILNQFLSDREQLEKMGQKSLALVRERHAPEKTYQQFMDVVQKG